VGRQVNVHARLVVGDQPPPPSIANHFGSVDRMVDDLQRWRERYGLAYVVVVVESMEAFAPVVTRLAGR